jgi:hypothetical protein
MYEYFQVMSELCCPMQAKDLLWVDAEPKTTTKCINGSFRIILDRRKTVAVEVELPNFLDLLAFNILLNTMYISTDSESNFRARQICLQILNRIYCCYNYYITNIVSQMAFT